MFYLGNIDACYKQITDNLYLTVQLFMPTKRASSYTDSVYQILDTNVFTIIPSRIKGLLSCTESTLRAHNYFTPQQTTPHLAPRKRENNYHLQHSDCHKCRLANAVILNDKQIIFQ